MNIRQMASELRSIRAARRNGRRLRVHPDLVDGRLARNREAFLAASLAVTIKNAR